MDFVSYAMYLLYGLVVPFAVLMVLALLFGKRVKKHWEYEAEFRDASGRGFGEFDMELWQIANKESEPTFQAKFRLQHESLEAGQRVEVYVDDVLVLAGDSQKPGRIFLKTDAVITPLAEAAEGQLCRVVYGGREHFAAPLKPD